jgi:hypothetical protein
MEKNDNPQCENFQPSLANLSNESEFCVGQSVYLISQTKNQLNIHVQQLA